MESTTSPAKSLFGFIGYVAIQGLSSFKWSANGDAPGVLGGSGRGGTNRLRGRTERCAEWQVNSFIFTNKRNINMKETLLKSIVWREGNYFVAQCLSVDVSSFGDSKDEALANLDEALALYFEDMPVNELPLVIEPEIVDAHVWYA